MSPRAVMRQLLLKAVYENKNLESKYYYKLLKNRFFSLGESLRYRIVIKFFDLLIISPKLGFKIYSYIYTKYKGKILNQDSIAGRIS